MATGFDNSTVQHAQQELTSEDKKYAAENLNETDETRRNAVAEIKHWIEESDDLPVQNGDFLILRFLRTCKFDVEQTKDRIRNYYQQQSDLSEWYTNKDPFRPEMQELLDLGIFVPLRKPDSQGRIVFLIRPTLNDPNVHEIPNIIKICLLTVETAMKYYPAGSIYGVAFYIDGSNPTVRHILQFSPFVLKNIAHLWQKCYPMRCQKIVFFNISKILNVLIRTFRFFLTEKLKNRLYVYSNQKCFEDIPSDTLPIEYDGTNGTMQELIEYWKKLIEKNCDWIMKDEHGQSNEIVEPIKEDFQQTHL
ncbi:retinol-binding protein pinta-like [Solenopsis invicta]|uniref:retinol-binding protein pinta-like n=1 Tax=Solenopsis invicta TaxID=13686 RepID=UPI00193D65F2|nr:retinol-binding protein pinta-like [Solenopsis invicta]XP_039302690.1 retinol-binding protein pinta-like [Solenopsis invicta]